MQTNHRKAGESSWLIAIVVVVVILVGADGQAGAHMVVVGSESDIASNGRQQMYCSDPVMLPNYFAKCGKCDNCNRQRKFQHISNMVAEMQDWTHANGSANATFVTLTYDYDNQPRDNLGRGILNKTDIQRFLKRLRFKTRSRLRYYLVGEYGSKSWRPHYHIALFGYSNCHYGKSKFAKPTAQSKSYCCGHCNRIRDTWDKGIVQLDQLNAKTIGYNAGYIAKKLTNKFDQRLDSRPPEFATMSLRPGLGHIYALQTIRRISGALKGNVRQHDIPRTFTHDGNTYFFSRNHRNLMREWCGHPRKISQTEWSDYVETYSTLPFLRETSPKAAFLASWQPERKKYEASLRKRHETI